MNVASVTGPHVTIQLDKSSAKMKTAHLRAVGIKSRSALAAARACIKMAQRAGLDSWAVQDGIKAVSTTPKDYTHDPVWRDLATVLIDEKSARKQFVARKQPAPWHKWGTQLDDGSIQQMKNACNLPISVAGALMPDAHTGYGLPIGGVLATDNAIIPYAVGVDIACRMKLTVVDIPIHKLEKQRSRLIEAIEAETRFGVGCTFSPPRHHPVMEDRAWKEIDILRELKPKAIEQLGTSGSGNHFVEFGLLEVSKGDFNLAPGQYMALLSHSGSRGTGESIAKHYSNLAMRKHPELPRDLAHLAWLDMDSQEGREYWRAMTLMGQYSAANHQLIHEHIIGHLGIGVLAGIENHHNFAWREVHNGREVIVHRKGAIPAGKGVLGIIPGTMVSQAHIVRGKGNPLSLNSAAHGAGRAMSRKAAIKRFSWNDMERALQHNDVHLISAGLDEAPMAYKDIKKVMAAQHDLVESIALFHPRLVKMSPADKFRSRKGKKGWHR